PQDAATTRVYPESPEARAADPGAHGRVQVPGYEVLGELGRGGMGVVYKARQIALNRPVALKMILAGTHAGAEELERFRTEAEAVACLQHPNIVQIHEVGDCDGLPFFSLEYVDGGSLAAKLRAGPLPNREAAEVVGALARAMHYAHRHDIVHRDLKPANVLLTADGTPKVTDFGLAKHLDSAGPTRSGAVMGTPSYMAPEQAAGRVKEIGPRTDVYALGAVLYECLTGRPPFQHDNPMETILQVLDEEPHSPRLYNRAVDASLEAICLKCLEKVPAERYPSAEALANDLAAYLAGEPVLADGSTSLRLLHMLLRETRHTEVMALWGRVWICHAGTIFVLCLLTSVLLWLGAEAAWPFVLLWAVGVAGLLAPIWYYRLRGGLPMTLLERQVAHVWAMFAAGFVLTGILNHLLGLPTLRLMPVVVLECGMGFGCMAIMLGGSFYLMAGACALLSLLLAVWPDAGPAVFGTVFAVGLLVPGLKHARGAAESAAGSGKPPEQGRG
ncbi:MAG TPA: serine/threonine-protein kinase, partial [Gemmataceae bacterium]|nr:serine/threonine-protein kinase [Gemmataceae bacterium]